MDNQKDPRKWIVWGNGVNWIVVEVDGSGQVIWESPWYPSQSAAEIIARYLRLEPPADTDPA